MVWGRGWFNSDWIEIVGVGGERVMWRGVMVEGGNDGDCNWFMWLCLLFYFVWDIVGFMFVDDMIVFWVVCVDFFLIGVFIWFDIEYEWDRGVRWENGGMC